MSLTDKDISEITQYIVDKQAKVLYYTPEKQSVVVGGASSNINYDLMRTKLYTNHIVYDNAHDFDYGIYPDPKNTLCKNLCDYSIIARKTAIDEYKSIYDAAIVGTDSTIKEHISNLTFSKFSPLFITSQDFTIDPKKTNLKPIQEYIKSKILNIPLNEEISNSKISFFHDMGGFFTEIMIKNKLSLAGDEDEADKDPSTSGVFHNFHHSTMLKAWDSSTGGSEIGNANVRQKITAQNSAMILLAYNLHALATMFKYFAVDFKDACSSLFGGDSKAYIPFLQSKSIIKNREFEIEICFIKLSKASEIYKSITDKYQSNTADKTNFINYITNTIKLYNSDGTLNYKQNDIILGSNYGVSYPVKKFSVNSILMALNLPLNSKRSGNPNAQSVEALERILTKIPQLKSGLNPTSRAKYLFMLKHSGDTCQGLQTGMAYNMFKLILPYSDEIAIDSVLYTEDVLAFCNAVFNGNNVMTIALKNNVVSIYHTTKEVSINTFIPTIKKIHTYLTSIDAAIISKTPRLQSEIAYFNKIINAINNSAKNQVNVIELIQRLNEYAEYFSLSQVFTDIIKRHADDTIKAEYKTIDFGKYEELFTFNSIFLNSQSTGSAKSSPNKLGIAKYKDIILPSVTCENIETIISDTAKVKSLKETFDSINEDKTLKPLDKLNELFLSMLKFLVENSKTATWVESVFKTILDKVNSDLQNFHTHVTELKSQYKKLYELKKYVANPDKIFSAIKLIKDDTNKTATDYDYVINDIYEDRFTKYKEAILDRLLTPTVSTTTSIKYRSTNKKIYYEIQISNIMMLSYFLLTDDVKQIYRSNNLLKKSKSFKVLMETSVEILRILNEECSLEFYEKNQAVKK